MPRGKVTPTSEIEHLSTLHSNGGTDDSLVRSLSDDQVADALVDVEAFTPVS
jgi:hypothetical protein